MRWDHWLAAGLIGTFFQVIVEAATAALRFTRISLVFLLGTIFSEHRGRALGFGFVAHLVTGLGFALVYVGIFKVWGPPSWWRGAIIGVLQASWVLLVAMPMLPAIHPRMASERFGPSATRQLEPPGFAAINYGPKTPLSFALSHVVFGLAVGWFYGDLHALHHPGG